MSKRDYLNHKNCLKAFRGKPVTYIAATNSLKLQDSRNAGRGKPYIWLDPSWALFKNGKELANSREYPYHTESLYLLRHRNWCKKIRMLHGKNFLSLKLEIGNVSVFKFSCGYEIHSYASTYTDIESDYDDWYSSNIT